MKAESGESRCIRSCFLEMRETFAFEYRKFIQGAFWQNLHSFFFSCFMRFCSVPFHRNKNDTNLFFSGLDNVEAEADFRVHIRGGREFSKSDFLRKMVGHFWEFINYKTVRNSDFDFEGFLASKFRSKSLRIITQLGRFRIKLLKLKTTNKFASHWLHTKRFFV